MEALEFLRIVRNICNRQTTCSKCPLCNTMPGCFEFARATDIEQDAMLARVQEVADMYGATPTDDTDNALEAIRRDMTGMEMRITELTEAVEQLRRRDAGGSVGRGGVVHGTPPVEEAAV